MNPSSKHHLERVRALCLELPGTTDRISHGESTFFVGKKVFVMFADDHHNDGRVAVWVPVPPGMQESLIDSRPDTFFRPPYVGVRGWVGIVLDEASDELLGVHVEMAWEMIAPKRLLNERGG